MNVHREPFLRAVTCPPEQMPANCASLYNLAVSKSMYVRCTYAIGYALDHVDDGEEIISVLLAVAGPGVQLRLRWESLRGGEKLGFSKGFVQRANEWPESIGFTEARRMVSAS